MTRLWVLLLVMVLNSPEPALAHAPIKGIGAFYNGLLHPLLVPAHALVILGLGLLLGRLAPSQESRLGWLAFVVAVCVGLLAGLWWWMALPQVALIAIALLAAMVVLFDLPSQGYAGVVLAAVAGIAIGFDSSADILGRTASGGWLSVTGIAVGAVLWLTYIGGLSAQSERPWHSIAVRVVASWTIATSVIVFALWSVNGTTH